MKSNDSNNKTPATTVETFENLLYWYENNYIVSTVQSIPVNSDTVTKLATAIAYSVLNKCIDPQRKTAPTRDSISDNGINPALVALKRELIADSKRIAYFNQALAMATGITFDSNGNFISIEPDFETPITSAYLSPLGDGLDLVNTAVVALLENSEKYCDGATGFMSRPITVRRLSKRVLIQSKDSAHFSDVITTPIQEVYRTVRRAIADSRATATDPRNGYTYITDLATDPETNALETIYIRQGKYADLGGYDCNGLYSADKETADRTTDLLTRLELNTRQATVVSLRLRGYGNKAIATYLGIDPANVKRTLKQIQAKCVAMGFSPVGLASLETA